VPAALRRSDPKARRSEAAHQLPAVDQCRARCKEAFMHVFGNVIVVAVKAALRNAHLASERVELIQGGVRHQVPPDAPVARPQRGIDEERHVQGPYATGRPSTPISAADAGNDTVTMAPPGASVGPMSAAETVPR